MKRFFFTRNSKLVGGRSVPDNSQQVWLRNQGGDQLCACRQRSVPPKETSVSRFHASCLAVTAVAEVPDCTFHEARVRRAVVGEVAQGSFPRGDGRESHLSPRMRCIHANSPRQKQKRRRSLGGVSFEVVRADIPRKSSETSQRLVEGRS